MDDFFDTFQLDAGFTFEALSSSADGYYFFGNLKTDEYLVTPNMLRDFDLPGLRFKNLISVWERLIDERDRKRYRESLEGVISGKSNSHEAEYQAKMRDGRYVWLHCHGRIMRDEETKAPIAFLGCAQNLEKSIGLDQTTGLPSFDQCLNDLDQTIACPDGSSVGVLLVGIDRFSQINAAFDHLFGDAVLHHTAQDILRLLPNEASIYRYEGDQIIVVLRKADETALRALYESIQQYAAKPHDVDGTPYRITLSGGATLLDGENNGASDLVENASLALRHAKESGRNCFTMFTPELFKSHLRKRMVRRIVGESVRSRDCRDFFVVYQPIVDAATLDTTGVEALLRFQSDELGLLYPEEILPVLEESKLMGEAGAKILRCILDECAPWVSAAPNLVINANVSRLQIENGKFYDEVKNMLEEHGLEPHHLLLDLSEKQFAAESRAFEENLMRLRALGVKVAMDDFGTGCSSLGKLDGYGVDVLKIDPLFVTALDSSGYNHDFIGSVIRLCHNIGMTVCVEGIETLDDRICVQNLGADYLQGRYLSEPLRADDFFKRFIADQAGKAHEESAPKTITQKKLVGDKSLLRLMMDATPMCVTILDADHNCIDCNNEAVRVFGAADTQDYIDHFYEFSPKTQPDGSDSATESHRKISTAFEQGICTFSWMHCGVNGEELPFEITLVRLNYQNEYVLAGYARDLRPQIAAEQAEKAGNERVKMLLDASPLFVSLWNRDYHNIECNQEALNLFGVKDKSTYLNHFYELSPEVQPDGTPTSEKIKEVINKAFEEGRYVCEWMHRSIEGEAIPSEVTLVRLMYQGEYVVAGYTRDMRPQIEAERTIRESAKRVGAIVRALPLSSMFWSSKGEMIECNQQTVKMFKLSSEEEVKERYYSDLIPEFQPDGLTSREKLLEMVKMTKSVGRSVVEWMYRTADGEDIPSELTLVLIEDDGDDFQIASYCRDLRELQKTLEINRKLQELAFFDPLTGASSRSNFMQMLETRVAELEEGDAFGLAIFDLDRFKDVNDLYGHIAGDLALQMVVDVIKNLLPEDCIIGRYGGDEFMIQSGSMSMEEFDELAARMLSDIARNDICCEDQSFRETISLGCCFWTPDCKTHEALLEKADEALYEAKNAGRNRYVVKSFS